MTSATTNLDKHQRFPGEIISHAVGLYCRLPLSHKDVEELLFVRGVIGSYEAIRKWCRKFGQQYANQLRRPRPGDTWHLDEVFWTSNGERHSLWRAVDQDRHVLAILVHPRRAKTAAKKFFRPRLKGGPYVPRVISTDKLKSYGAARAAAGYSAPPTSGPQQPCRELAPTHAPAGTAHARVQGRRAHATVSRGIWSYCPTLSPAAASLMGARVPASRVAERPGVERDHGDSDRG